MFGKTKDYHNFRSNHSVRMRFPELKEQIKHTDQFT